MYRASQGPRARKGFAEVKDEGNTQEVLVGVAGTFLSNMVGEGYGRAAVDCLTNGFEEGARDTEDPMRLHRAFGERAVGGLARGVGGRAQ